MASSKSETYVTEALERLADVEPENCAKVKGDAGQMTTLREEAKKTVDELLETIENVKKKKEERVTILEAFKHLSKERIDKITNTFRNQTYFMSLDESGETRQFKCLMRNGKEFQSAVGRPFKDATKLQIASIVVETVILLLDIMGINVPEDEEALSKSINIVIDELGKSSSLIQDVDNLQKGYKEHDPTAMAKAIVSMTIDLYAEGIFITIAKALMYNLSLFGWLITAAKIVAFMIALVATAGAAEIAEIITILASASEFLAKLANLDVFA